MTFKSESASELFSRFGNTEDVDSFEKNLFPSFTSEDIVEISGEAGSCKTELLYHLTARCIFPSSWKGLQFNGLETEVVFIDNDCHFDLFRLISILEHRVKMHVRASSANVSKKEILTFIQDRLKSLHIIKCCDCDDFILALNSLESSLCLQGKGKFIMVDGLSSFYWSDKARVQNNFSKLNSHYKIIVNLIMKIAKTCKHPVIATRRKLMSSADNDRKVLGHVWNSAVNWRLELKFKSSLPDKTLLSVFSSPNSCMKLCCVNNAGFHVLEKKNDVQ